MGMRWPTATRYIATWACGVLALLAGAAGAAQSEGFVAGTAPDRRPEGAPSITTFAKGEQWMAGARAGISDPLPPSLKFLDDQGAWFTPFTHPGMPGPYDIRGLHAKGTAAAGASAQ